MAQRFRNVTTEEWQQHIRTALKDTNMKILPNDSYQQIIIRVAKEAGHPHPHSNIYSAQLALRRMIASGEISDMRNVGLAQQAQKPRIHDESSNNFLDYLADVHRAILLFGNRLSYFEAELARQKEQEKQIPAMQKELQELIEQILAHTET